MLCTNIQRQRIIFAMIVFGKKFNKDNLTQSTVFYFHSPTHKLSFIN